MSHRNSPCRKRARKRKKLGILEGLTKHYHFCVTCHGFKFKFDRNQLQKCPTFSKQHICKCLAIFMAGWPFLLCNNDFAHNMSKFMVEGSICLHLSKLIKPEIYSTSFIRLTSSGAVTINYCAINHLSVCATCLYFWGALTLGCLEIVDLSPFAAFINCSTVLVHWISHSRS